MFRHLLLVVAGAAILLDGYVYGRWTGRWHESRELREAAARLDQVPFVIGDWKGEAVHLDAKAVERAEFSGYILRRYENKRTGAVVSVLVACGRPGPISVHSPQVCYGGAGFQLASSESNGEYWKATFSRENAPERLRVLWSWYANGVWSTPENPRWKFAAVPVLHKMYVSQQYFPRDDATDGGAAVEFLKDLLPVLNRVFTENRK